MRTAILVFPRPSSMTGEENPWGAAMEKKQRAPSSSLTACIPRKGGLPRKTGEIRCSRRNLWLRISISDDSPGQESAGGFLVGTIIPC